MILRGTVRGRLVENHDIFEGKTNLRVRPANYQSGWKLHGSDLRENCTVGSPRLVFHENGPNLGIWAFKKPKK